MSDAKDFRLSLMTRPWQLVQFRFSFKLKRMVKFQVFVLQNLCIMDQVNYWFIVFSVFTAFSIELVAPAPNPLFPALAIVNQLREIKNSDAGRRFSASGDFSEPVLAQPLNFQDNPQFSATVSANTEGDGDLGKIDEPGNGMDYECGPGECGPEHFVKTSHAQPHQFEKDSSSLPISVNRLSFPDIQVLKDVTSTLSPEMATDNTNTAATTTEMFTTESTASTPVLPELEVSSIEIGTIPPDTELNMSTNASELPMNVSTESPQLEDSSIATTAQSVTELPFQATETGISTLTPTDSPAQMTTDATTHPETSTSTSTDEKATTISSESETSNASTTEATSTVFGVTTDSHLLQEESTSSVDDQMTTDNVMASLTQQLSFDQVEPSSMEHITSSIATISDSDSSETTTGAADPVTSDSNMGELSTIVPATTEAVTTETETPVTTSEPMDVVSTTVDSKLAEATTEVNLSENGSPVTETTEETIMTEPNDYDLETSTASESEDVSSEKTIHVTDQDFEFEKDMGSTHLRQNLSSVASSVSERGRDLECHYEDIEMFKRNIQTATFGYNLRSEPSLMTFVAGSPCVGVFSDVGQDETVSIRKMWPALLPYSTTSINHKSRPSISAAGFADGCIYFAESGRGRGKWMRSFKYNGKDRSYEETTKSTSGTMTESEFLHSVCGIESSEFELDSYRIKSFLKLPSSSTCFVFNETSLHPLISPNATLSELSLAGAIEHMLRSEYVNAVQALFVWADEPSVSIVYVYGSNGELYVVHRNRMRNGAGFGLWRAGDYALIPYEQFPA